MNEQDAGLYLASRGAVGAPPARLPVEHPVDDLVNDMLDVRTGGVIALYCGEAHPYVYNSQRFLDTAREVVEGQQAKIVAITGPVMLVPEDEQDHNGLVTLAKQGTLKGLYHRRARFTTGHFRVVETGYVYKLYREESHAAGAGPVDRWCDDMSRFCDRSIQSQAEDALALFSEWKSMAVRHADAKKGQELPLITTPSKLARIVEHAESMGLDFNYLEPREIMDVAAELGAAMIQPLSSYRPGT